MRSGAWRSCAAHRARRPWSRSGREDTMPPAVAAGSADRGHASSWRPEMKRHNAAGPSERRRAVSRGALGRRACVLAPAAIVTLAGLPADEADAPDAREHRARVPARCAIRRGGRSGGHPACRPRQPAAGESRSDRREPDGLDEIFLPADVAGWDGVAGRVTNAIVDDEIRAVGRSTSGTRARSSGSIVDACHSGTMSRADAGVPAARAPDSGRRAGAGRGD